MCRKPYGRAFGPLQGLIPHLYPRHNVPSADAACLLLFPCREALAWRAVFPEDSIDFGLSGKAVQQICADNIRCCKMVAIPVPY